MPDPWRANQGFWFSIVWCSHNGNHPQEDLAKFGYRSQRKVRKKKEKRNRAKCFQLTKMKCRGGVFFFFFFFVGSCELIIYCEKSVVNKQTPFSLSPISWSLAKWKEPDTIISYKSDVGSLTHSLISIDSF